MQSSRWLACACAMLFSLTAIAQETSVPQAANPAPHVAGEGSTGTPPPADGRLIDTITVSGRQPGPGLWKVSKGEHVLWILGTLSPLPRGMEWDAQNVEEIVAGAQELILAPSVYIKSDVGFFGRLAMIPTAFKARKNPDGKLLQDLVPEADYARWQVLKARYIGNDRGIEQWRPIFAAFELYNRAIKASGMTTSSVVGERVGAIAKRAKLTTTSSRVELKITNAKGLLKEFTKTSLDDIQCFTLTLSRLENDVANMAARANAWATGDIASLRDLPFRNQFTACNAAFTEAALARKAGIQDLAQQMERKWMANAEAALARNASTFATLPIAELLKPDGYVAKLRAKGYVVESPE